MAAVILFDVDNTLFNNDAVKDELDRYLQRCGERVRKRFWGVYEDVRRREDVVDFPAVLWQLEREHFPDVRDIRDYLLQLSFADYVFPGAFAALRHAADLGENAILTDGDAYFQPFKIHRSGLWDAVQGRVLITTHKQREFAVVERRWPEQRYVLIDDKVRILEALKQQLGERFVAVWVRQGHYAQELPLDQNFEPDFVLDGIADFAHLRRFV
ncbi:MAG: HAD family hydrolase [Chloroflexi bacterium]|nr:HAD family hydrolase [Chloroflexota bacterium]